jgi:hypothetical protein
MVVRWEFLDPQTLDTAVFEINPDEGGTPSYSKNITSHSTVAHNGKTIVFEGSAPATELNFSGTILTESMYNLLYNWFSLPHQVQLTDDLARVWLLYITKFEAKRVRSAIYPWKHTYTVTTLILDWP